MRQQVIDRGSVWYLWISASFAAIAAIADDIVVPPEKHR